MFKNVRLITQGVKSVKSIRSLRPHRHHQFKRTQNYLSPPSENQQNSQYSISKPLNDSMERLRLSCAVLEKGMEKLMKARYNHIDWIIDDEDLQCVDAIRSHFIERYAFVDVSSERGITPELLGRYNDILLLSTDGTKLIVGAAMYELDPLLHYSVEYRKGLVEAMLKNGNPDVPEVLKNVKVIIPLIGCRSISPEEIEYETYEGGVLIDVPEHSVFILQKGLQGKKRQSWVKSLFSNCPARNE